MTEHDYINVSDLAKARLAMSIIGSLTHGEGHAISSHDMSILRCGLYKCIVNLESRVPELEEGDGMRAEGAEE